MKGLPRLGCALLVLALAGTACGGDDGDSGGGRIELTIGVFGDMGFSELYKKFEAEHPNIHIVERETQAAEHHSNLAQRLATNQGANDIEAIEEGYIAQFKVQPDKFVNLLDRGAQRFESLYLDWKWEQSLSPDGKTQIGLGTDVGGLAMCYRHDLFQKAGLPTDRTAVSAMWPDWDAYFASGRTFAAADTGATFFDGAGSIFNAVIGQSEEGYYDTDNKVIVGSNPAVKNAWDLVVGGVGDGLSAELAPFSEEWNTAIQKGTFATIACPAWMLGPVLAEQAPDFAGKWDVADLPGGLGGNWGGSFLTIPKQGKHQDEAWELIQFLSEPQQQKFVFTEHNLLPSQPALYDDPEITGQQNPYFNNAPVGEIFTTSAKNLVVQYQGPRAGDIETSVIGAGLTRVEQGKQDPDDAWAQVLDEVKEFQ